MPRLCSKWILGALLLVGVLGLACSDKGTEPKPANYRLYVAKTGNPEGWVAVVDCATDSIVDTLRYGFQQDGVGVVASPDGRYLAVTGSGRPPLIWDVSGRAPIGYLTAPMLAPLFIPEARIVVGPQWDSTIIFSMPAFTPSSVWRVEIIQAQRIPGTTWIIGTDFRGVPDPHDDWSKLAIVDYSLGREIDSVVIERDDEGVGFQVARFTLSPDGRRLYALGGSAGGAVPAWLRP